MNRLYNLIIVDDEFLIRDGLMFFDWEQLGFKAIGSATNGKKALEFFETNSVDVVLTDIKMPVLDGLELSKIICQKYPDCKVIFLTGHKEFEYAKVAVNTGVFAYLLKPVQTQELENLFISLRNKLEAEQHNSKLFRTYKMQLNESLPYAIESFYKGLLEGKFADIGEIDEKMNLLELSLSRQFFSCAVLQCDSFSKLNHNVSIMALLTNILNDFLGTRNLGQFFYSKDVEIIIILNFDSPNAAQPTYEFLTSAVEEIRNKLIKTFEQSFISSLYVGVGNIYNNIQSVSNSYYQATEALSRKFFVEDKYIFYAWKEKPSLLKSIIEYPFDKEKVLLDSIIEGNKEHSLSSLHAFWDEFSLFLCHIEPSEIQNIAVQLLNMLERRLNKHGTYLEHFLEINSPFISFVEGFRSLSDLKDAIKKIVLAAVSEVNEINAKVKTTSHLSIEKAIEYIEEHYSEKISLNQVAEHVYLNASYLSTQFKKEIGINFIDYLKELRIKKAKEFLKRIDLKVYEVSAMVGYENTKYFSDTFKLYTGLTPLEYKRKLISD